MTNITWLITGASRGIGLETVHQLLQISTNTIFATCRSPSTAVGLKALAASPGTLHIVKLDVADEASVKTGTEEVIRLLDGAGLDYVLNIAGIKSESDRAFSFKPSDLLDTMVTNVIGPALVSRYLLPAIEKSDRRVIMNMTSKLGSISGNHGVTNATYCTSKTALNMLTYKQARERPDLIIVVMEPGWTKTDMGGPQAPIEPTESVAGMLKVLHGLTKESTGRFFGYKGDEVPW